MTRPDGVAKSKRGLISSAIRSTIYSETTTFSSYTLLGEISNDVFRQIMKESVLRFSAVWRLHFLSRDCDIFCSFSEKYIAGCAREVEESRIKY